MKILKHIFNVLVWALVGLYLLFMITTNIPAVQRYLGRQTAKMMAQKLGTSVSIGQVNIGIPNHLTFDNVLIRDQQGKDMLQARRLSARIDLLPLSEGRISISTAQLFGVHAKFYQATADAKPNFQFVLDSLASKDTTNTNPLDLRINSLIIRHSSVTYDRYDIAPTHGKINPGHLNFSDISAHVILKTLTPDSINVNVKRLSLREQSGIQLNRLSLRFEGGRSHSLLQDFVLRMPGTSISLGDIEATYRFRGDHFITPSLIYRGSILNSNVTLSDLEFLLPSLKNFTSTLSFSSTFTGRGEDLEVPSLLVSSTTGDVDININGWGKQLTQDHPIWYADINDLHLSAKAINFISENLEGERIEVPPVLVRLGDIHMKGFVNGTGLKELRTHSQLSTTAGNVAVNFSMNPARQFQADIDTKGINLQQLLDDERFGQLATKIDLSGQLPAQSSPSVTAKGLISQFEYNGYQYRNIDINGSYSSSDVNGRLTINDPNIGLDIVGRIEKTGKSGNGKTEKNDVKLTATLLNLSPKAIHLSDKWGEARFFGELDANFKASTLNDAVGTLDINNFYMLSPTANYELANLHVESGYSDETHFVTLTGDFGEAEILGNFDYETLTQSFTNLLASKLPTLPGLPKATRNTGNNFAINARIQKSDWLRQLLQVPIVLSEPLTLQGMINDRLSQVNIECDIPSGYYDDNGYRNGHISISSPHDSLKFDVRITKLAEESNPIDLHAFGTAFNNQLHTSLQWDNHATERMKGQINATADFDTSIDGRQTAHVQLAPSLLTIRNTDWHVTPCHITYYNKHLDIDNFEIRHQQQHLLVKGTASESSLDSLNIDLQDIDLDYVLALVDFDAVSFSGLATGGGSVKGIFGDFRADGQLRVDNFLFEHGRMGTLNATVGWNAEREQIDINAISDDGPDAMTYIDGYVSPKRDSINLAIRGAGTHLDFARSFTSSFLDHVEGHAVGDLRLIGPLSAINLTGDLVLNGRVHVSATNCNYELRNDSLHLVPNEIEFVNCPIYDTHGRQGIITGGIHHKDLTQLTYDIFVDAKNLLAYDFREFGDDTFYGSVFADGRVEIHGRKNGVTINADVTPQTGTVFVYNAASPDAITNQEFIEWNATKADTTEVQGKNTPSSAEKTDRYRSDLHMNFHINATPQATVRLLMDARTNDYITLHGNGDLQATFYNKGTFNLFGTYRVTDGTYDVTIQDIIHKNFTFQDGGTIVFGGDPYDAALNLQAQHVVQGVSLSDLNVGRSFSNTVRVNCLMNITGQPRQPVVDFDLDIPNVNTDEKQMVRSIINSEDEMNQQVIYLLAVGRFYPQQANNADTETEGPSKTSLAMQSLLSGTLSGQLNSMLGQVIKNDNWNFGANISTGDEGWNNAEYEGLVSGRMLNNRLLINGQFGYRDNATTATPSFIGDFDIRYLLFPNGNLALKVYNQANDRYFTKSSLNTQGIGIIMKKDFSGLGDLFGTRKKKEKMQQATDREVKK